MGRLSSNDASCEELPKMPAYMKQDERMIDVAAHHAPQLIKVFTLTVGPGETFNYPQIRCPNDGNESNSSV